MIRTGASRRRFPLQWHLVLLVAAATLPLFAFAVILTLRIIDDARERAHDRLGKLTEMLSVDLERELQSTIGTLQALALSERFDRNDLAGMQRTMERVVESRPDWHAASVLTVDGRQVINTAFQFGRAPERPADTASFRAVLTTRQPTVGNLAFGRFGSGWTFPVRVPVVRGDSLLYIVSALVQAEGLAGVVSHSLARDEWTRTVVDSRSVIVARTRNPEKWVGVTGTPSYRKQTRGALHGIYLETALEGPSVYLSFHRSRLSDWTVSIAAPVEVIDGPADQAIVAVLIVGGLVAVASAFGAHLLSRHVRRGIVRASGAARSLAAGQHPEIAGSSITEVADLFDALRQSAELLEQRERERDENLERAQTARALAEDASRAKDEFLATLGHELRNPLAPIVLAIEMLKDEQASTTPELDVIERQVAHLRRLIDDLLDISRIARSKVALQFETIDLRTAITRAVEMSRPLVERRGHRLSVSLGTEPIHVGGDAVRLAQVFDNLLTNAARYTPPGGSIRVDCTTTEEAVDVTVTDDGEGITTDLLPHIFDLFVQGHAAGRRAQGGLGIGLSLVRSLVQLHGGSVQAASAGPGLGSTFTVRLPLSTARVAIPEPERDHAPVVAAAGPASRPARSTATPLRVLIVDDNDDAALLLAEYLRHQGLDALAVHSAAEALEVIDSFRPVAAILDIGMPNVDGYELAIELRGRGVGAPPVLFALSGFGQQSDIDKSLRHGFRRHFVKPADPAAIVAELRALEQEEEWCVPRSS